MYMYYVYIRTCACTWGTYIIIILIEDNHINFTWFCVMVTLGLAAKKCMVGWSMLRRVANGMSYVICISSPMCAMHVCVEPCIYFNMFILVIKDDFQIQCHTIIMKSSICHLQLNGKIVFRRVWCTLSECNQLLCYKLFDKLQLLTAFQWMTFRWLDFANLQISNSFM